MFAALKSVQKICITVMLIAMTFSVVLPFIPSAMGVNGGQAQAESIPFYICSGGGIIVIDHDDFASDTPAKDTERSAHCPFCNTMSALALPAWERRLVGRVTSAYRIWTFLPEETPVGVEPSDGPFPPRAPPVLA
jgi:hypothetical protein